MSRNIHIIIADPSSIVVEGLATILLQSGFKAYISKADTFGDILPLHLKRSADIVLINPGLVLNNEKSFNGLQNQMENVQWIAVVYAYYDISLLSLFDANITISESSETIVSTVEKMLKPVTNKEPNVLSEREIDVLKLLVSGLSNKEIADKLNISINTVITHRKNISIKTEIKSVSGLTIYAVVKKLINIENLSE